MSEFDFNSTTAKLVAVCESVVGIPLITQMLRLHRSGRAAIQIERSESSPLSAHKIKHVHRISSIMPVWVQFSFDTAHFFYEHFEETGVNGYLLT